MVSGCVCVCVFFTWKRPWTKRYSRIFLPFSVFFSSFCTHHLILLAFSSMNYTHYLDLHIRLDEVQIALNGIIELSGEPSEFSIHSLPWNKKHISKLKKTVSQLVEVCKLNFISKRKWSRAHVWKDTSEKLAADKTTIQISFGAHFHASLIFLSFVLKKSL